MGTEGRVELRNLRDSNPPHIKYDGWAIADGAISKPITSCLSAGRRRVPPTNPGTNEPSRASNAEGARWQPDKNYPACGCVLCHWLELIKARGEALAPQLAVGLPRILLEAHRIWMPRSGDTPCKAGTVAHTAPTMHALTRPTSQRAEPPEIVASGILQFQVIRSSFHPECRRTGATRTRCCVPPRSGHRNGEDASNRPEGPLRSIVGTKRASFFPPGRQR
jgi:hypothetical protein